MHYLIIGNSAAGIFAAEAIREVDENGEITILSNEIYPAYARCLTSYYLSGNYTEEKTFLRSMDYYQMHRFNLILGKEALSVDAQGKRVILADGESISYDKLLIATGSRPTIPNISGKDLKGVFGLRTLKDAQGILNHLGQRQEVVVIGGGFVALKTAYALKLAKKKVTLIISSNQVLSQMLDEEAANIIAKHLTKLGIQIILQNDVTKINGSVNTHGEETLESVELKNGVVLPADVVIIGKGVTPNLELIHDTGINTDDGILVNKHLQTSIDDIFAAGDVAQGEDILTNEKKINAIWPNATEQGRIAGLNMAGKKVAYTGSLSMNAIDFAGLSCIAAGITKPHSQEDYEIYQDTKDSSYCKLILNKGCLVGYILIGDIHRAGILTALIKEKVYLGGYKSLLVDRRVIPKILW